MPNPTSAFPNTTYVITGDKEGSRPAKAGPLRWSEVFGGSVLSLFFYMMLMALGLAVGATGLGAGPATWGVVSSAISLYLGTLLAGRTSDGRTPGLGGVQGLASGCLFFVFLFSQIGATIGATVARVPSFEGWAMFFMLLLGGVGAFVGGTEGAGRTTWLLQLRGRTGRCK